MWLDRNALLSIGGMVIAAGWFVAYLAGAHPDGAILGFAGSTLLIAGGSERHERIRHERRRRRPSESAESDRD